MSNVEYRVRPVTRYVVTRFYSNYEVVENGGTFSVSSRGEGGCETCGEFDREDMAQKIARALAKCEPEGEVTCCGEIVRINADDGVTEPSEVASSTVA